MAGIASATFAIALVYASFGATVARAQYSNSDDGGYASGPGGYNDDDDEDGYEDGQDAPDVVVRRLAARLGVTPYTV